MSIAIAQLVEPNRLEHAPTTPKPELNPSLKGPWVMDGLQGVEPIVGNSLSAGSQPGAPGLPSSQMSVSQLYPSHGV